MKLFNKILIANRGEIARRIIRTCREMGIGSVAVYSDLDMHALYKNEADEAIHLPGTEISETYLNIKKLIETAKNTGAEAIHPGYGFLSENADFAEAVQNAGIAFIGPDAAAIRQMGHKTQARIFAEKAGLPVSKGITGSTEEILQKATELPYPVLVKAAAGGGGKGMRIVENAGELPEILKSTQREAEAYFGNGEVYIEQFIQNPRHIEVQVLGDKKGNYIHLYERECSLQRRYQKIIEESPSPTLTDEVREKISKDAVRLAAQLKYSNAGTIEFLVDTELNYYFLEMNTRVQVEHPVTEMVTGVDIVRQQIIAAAGYELEFKQSDIRQNGHAIECRIYAEDPEENFRPSPGEMQLYREPEGNGLRIDSAYDQAGAVPDAFDPMISKMIVHAADRDEAIRKSSQHLKNYAIHGIKHNIPYLLELLRSPDFINNTVNTRYCDIELPAYLEKLKAARTQNHKELVAMAFLSFSLFHKDFRARKAGLENSVWEKIGFWRHLMQSSIKIDEEDYEISIEKISPKNLIYSFLGKQFEISNLKAKDGQILFETEQQQIKAWISCDGSGLAEVSMDGQHFHAQRNDVLFATEFNDDAGASNKNPGNIHSPMPGKIVEIFVETGQKVSKGDKLLIVEAMKMENLLRSAMDGEIAEINVVANQRVGTSETLVKIKEL